MKWMPTALAVLAVASFALPLPAQTPEQAAERFLATVKTQDWAANAGMIAAPELDSLKAAFLDLAQADTSTAGLREIFAISSLRELQALPAAEVYRRFIADRVGQPQERERAQLISAATFHVLGHVDEGDTAYVLYRVTATVPSGTATQTSSQVTMLAMRRVGGVWKAPLSEDLRAFTAQLHGAAAQRRALAAPPTAPTPRPAPATPPTAPAAPPRPTPGG